MIAPVMTGAIIIFFQAFHDFHTEEKKTAHFGYNDFGKVIG